MTAKTNRPKKPSRPAPRARSAPARAKTKASVGESIYYVTEPGLAVVLSNQKPKVRGRVRQCATFEEARSAAVDGLVQAIEGAERQLLALKRAANYQEYSAARKAGWPA